MVSKLQKMRDRLMAKKGNKGFTLVELIVVIVILAILVGVTIGGVYGYVAKSRNNTDINNAAAITSTLQILTTAKEVKGTANAAITATIPAAGILKADLDGTDFGLNDDAAITTKLKELFPDGIPATKTGCTYTVTGNFNSEGSVGSIVVTATGLTAAE